MEDVVKRCVLFLSICSSCHPSPTCPEPDFVMADVGSSINVLCEAPSAPQDGVYIMRKKTSEINPEKIYYYYKEGNKTKKADYVNVKLEGPVTKVTATFYDLSVGDSGLYWCDFNLEDKVSKSKPTLLWVTDNSKECIATNNCTMNRTQECHQRGEIIEVLKLSIYIMIIVITILLFIVAFLFVKLMKNHDVAVKPSPEASIYEEMNKTRLNTGATLINPEYQSTKPLPFCD